MPHLSASLLRQLSQLRTTPPMAAASLRALVEAHRARARKEAPRNPFVDVDRADQVADACLALLDAAPSLPPTAHPWVQAACLYFGAEDDEEDDFDSIVGFDDDAEVVNHVAAELGLTHIRIEL